MGDGGRLDKERQAGDADERFNAKEAANFLGITERRLHQLRRRGQIASVQIGWRRYAFRSSELMAYVERLADQITSAAAPRPDAEAAPAAPKLREKSATDEAKQAVVETVSGLNQGSKGKSADGAVDEELINQAPIVRMANAIIVTALEERASDIHLEADQRNLRVRVRVDGVLREILAVPRYVQTPLFNRYKVMADLAYYKPVPQVGFIPLQHGAKDYDIRVASLPARFGDSMTLRIVDHTMMRWGWRDLGMGAECKAQVETLCARPQGLLLLSGRPGAGVTTTAYAVLSRLNDIERKIYTVEAVPGYCLAGVTQTYLRPEKGMTVSAIVQNLLEQDPDVLFLGDIDDVESAEWAVRAAEQGVFVIANLAAPSVFGALWLLAQLAPPPTRAARCIRGVLAQHLARRVCPECRAEDTGDNAVLRAHLLSRRQDLSVDARLARGAGCAVCRHTGYQGRNRSRSASSIC